jgi:metallo-beta-lactamase family protein
MHLLEAAGARILLDSGLFQGRRKESYRLNADLPVDPRQLDAIVLSHAHIDHSGRLPLLVGQGFHGPIYSTAATRDLCGIMLPDSAYIQEKDAEYLARRGKKGPESEPLYTMADAVAVQELLVGIPYQRLVHLRKHLTFEFTDAGHILGSASVSMRITEDRPHRLVFSGDVGRTGLPIIRDPRPPQGPVDTLIIESTYANRAHESVRGAEDHLGEIVRRAAARGGKVLIPAFAVGRTQEIIYALHALYRAGKIPEISCFVDSPLAVNATDIFRLHPEVFDRREALVDQSDHLFQWPMVHYVRDVSESKALNSRQGPAVIVAASGMIEAGRILHHLSNHGGDHRNVLLFVGYQAEHTLGRRILEGNRTIRVFGEMMELRAEVETIDGYSAHADKDELREWVRRLGGPIRRAFVVHGEKEATQAMAELLREEGVEKVILPKLGQSFDL